MARCGCDTAQSTTCEAIMACIKANLGPGLDYNETTRNLEVRLSRDAGNSASFGSDDGFYAPAGTGPGPIVWPKTVATLPAQAIAATGGSNLVGPSTAPHLIEYAIANNLDIYTTAAFNLADEVSFGGPGASTHRVSLYTDNPSDVDNKDLGSVNLPSLLYDAGTRVSPTARNAPAQFIEPDGGWAGFYNHPYPAQTIAGLLRMVRGRMVVALHTQRLSFTQAEAEANIRSAVQAVVDAGAQAWVMIYIPAALSDNSRAPIDQWASIVTDAGITAGISLSGETGMPDPWTGAELAATSATWLEVRSPVGPGGATDARIAELVATGMNVQVYINDGRQYWAQHAFGLGARAIRAADGVYARGARGQAGDLAYRQTFIPGLATRTAAVGAMTPHTVDHTAVFNAGFARQDEPGRWFPPKYGWNGGIPDPNHQLLGTICPIPNATDYRIRLRVWRPERDSSITSAQFAGIYFAAADDRGMSYLSPNQLGYSAQVHPFADLVTWQNMELVRHDGGTNTTLASSEEGPGWAYEEWTDLEVTVQGATITFTATASGGSTTISATDSTYRGPYAFYAWYETFPRPIVHAYDNPTDLVMYEALS